MTNNSEYYAHNASKIGTLPIWIGSKLSATNVAWLKQNQITAVLNCCMECPAQQYKCLKYYLKISIDDLQSQTLEIAIPMAVNYINTVVKSGGRILIHCHAGVSRSVSLVIAYLMIIHKLTYKQAYGYILKYRPIANPNNGFIQQLSKLENK